MEPLSLEATARTVWGVLGLPAPRPGLPRSLAEWSVRDEARRHVWRRGAGLLGDWFAWWSLRQTQPFHPLARPERGERLRELARVTAEGPDFWRHQSPRFRDHVALMEALAALRRHEAGARRRFATAERAWSLTLQAMLLYPSAAQPARAAAAESVVAALVHAGDWLVGAAADEARVALWDGVIAAARGLDCLLADPPEVPSPGHPGNPEGARAP
jgi:hypothetical protein